MAPHFKTSTLFWILPPLTVLSGAANANHLLSNLQMQRVQLSESDIELLQNLAISRESYWTERKALSWN
ncbi:MAG: hypothetical protein HRU41_42210 [Saprospiraceae bacterium]|nr:hypothetical protein [Saprospiraceae bacterium]